MLDVIHWNIDREIVSFGPLALRWYSLLFAGGILAGYYIVRSMFRREGQDESLIDSLLFHVVLGTIVGARLGHVLFYEPSTYLANPIRILKVWEGGLASHGGYLGVTIALILFAYRYRQIPLLWLLDRVSVPSMLGAATIRLGNFFNSEIIGRPTGVPWAVVFEKIDQVPRHPSQIYESLGYLGVFLTGMAVYKARFRTILDGRIFGLMMILGFGYRFFVEHFKENQEAFEQSLTFNMGQLLSVPFILIGCYFFFGLHGNSSFWRRFSRTQGARSSAGGSNVAKDTSTAAVDPTASGGKSGSIESNSPRPARSKTAKINATKPKAKKNSRRRR